MKQFQGSGDVASETRQARLVPIALPSASTQNKAGATRAWP